jgi:hypothetical protein
MFSGDFGSTLLVLKTYLDIVCQYILDQIFFKVSLSMPYFNYIYMYFKFVSVLLSIIDVQVFSKYHKSIWHALRNTEKVKICFIIDPKELKGDQQLIFLVDKVFI